MSALDRLTLETVWTSRWGGGIPEAPDASRRFGGPQTVRVRVWGRVGRKRFEFAWLGEGHQVEVYDHPKSWEGTPRFVGYMPLETGAKLLTMARAAVRRARSKLTRCPGETVDVRAETGAP